MELHPFTHGPDKRRLVDLLVPNGGIQTKDALADQEIKQVVVDLGRDFAVVRVVDGGVETLVLGALPGAIGATAARSIRCCSGCSLGGRRGCSLRGLGGSGLGGGSFRGRGLRGRRGASVIVVVVVVAASQDGGGASGCHARPGKEAAAREPPPPKAKPIVVLLAHLVTPPALGQYGAS